jgi:hypothetical protein
MAATGSRFVAYLPAAAIGVIAVALSIVGHETIGHGGACLAAGGHVTLLNIVDFHCSLASPGIDLAGTVGNLVLVLAGLTLAQPQASAGARLLGLALFAFNAFWIAGYLIYAGVLNAGDWVYPAQAWTPSLPWRPVAVAVGVVAYALTMRWIAVSTPSSAAGALRTAYVTATVAIVLAAPLYAPARAHVILQAFLEVGAASLGLWFAVRRARGPGAWAPPTSPVWAIVAVGLWTAIALTMGPGLPR